MYTITLENGMRFYIRPLKKEEIEEASFLSDECVGKNLYPKEEIAETLNDQEKFFYLLKNEKDETIGYIYYFLTNEEEMAKYSKLDINVYREVYSNSDKKVGKIQSVGIKREYRGNELAVEMMQFILKEMKKADPDAKTNYQEAKEAAKKLGTKMKIVPVKTAQEAIDYLKKTK